MDVSELLMFARPKVIAVYLIRGKTVTMYKSVIF